MSSFHPQRAAGGFSLIDALIAVVVLSTGILALTLLQVSMLRASAEARERSVAANIAQNIVEQLRATGIQSASGYAGLNSTGVFASGACNFAASTAISGYPADIRYCTTIKRWQQSGAGFVEVASSGSAAPVYGNTPEMKQMTVNVGWKRNDGTWGAFQLGDALSGIPLLNSNDLENRPLDLASTVPGPSPIFKGSNLSANTNFIPIAVGDSNIAATNPTPKVIGGNVAETSFEVYTYANANRGGYIKVERSVDTKVVGCKCTSKAAPALSAYDQVVFETGGIRPRRAAYWTGTGYKEPVPANYPVTDLIGTEQDGEQDHQSPLCDICCRDHHDPASVVSYNTGQTTEQDLVALFDPYRAAHTHYQDTSEDALANKVTSANQNYGEVCRLVRVNGIYRVSVDPLVDHFAFLPTDDSSTPAITYTTSLAAEGYADFVKEYIEKRIVPTNTYEWDNSSRVGVPLLEDTHGLNAQAKNTAGPLSIDLQDDDLRYLQNRGILLDNLSYEAKQRINECITQGVLDTQTCALLHTGFASINLTELSNWSVVPVIPASETRLAIGISPRNFSVTTPDGAPVAGRVFDASGANVEDVSAARAFVNKAISTLADRAPVFYQAITDTFWPMEDRQQFKFVGGARPQVKIRVNVLNLSYFDTRSGNSSAPYVGWVNAGLNTRGDCVRLDGTTAFECDLRSTGNAASIQIRLFNYHENLRAQNNGVPCTPKADLPKCGLYRPASVAKVASPSPLPITFTPPAFRTSATSGKPMDDESSVNLGSVANGEEFNVTFEASPSNPFVSGWSCAAVTGGPVLQFNDQECRRTAP